MNMSKLSNTFAATYAAFVAEAARNGFAVTLVPLAAQAPAQQPKAASTPKAQPKAGKPARKAKPKASKSDTKLYIRYCDAVGIEYPVIEAEYKAAKQPLYKQNGKPFSASTKCHWHHTQHPELLGYTEPLDYDTLNASI